MRPPNWSGWGRGASPAGLSGMAVGAAIVAVGLIILLDNLGIVHQDLENFSEREPCRVQSCWKLGGAAQNRPNECIKGVSKELRDDTKHEL